MSKDLTVVLQDRPGELARLGEATGSAGVIRQFEGGPEGIELIAFGARHDGDGETFPGWWAD